MVEIFRHIQHFHLWHRQEITIILSLRHFSEKMFDKKSKNELLCIALLGVSNGPIQFESARKIWPLLELLEKTKRGARLLVLAKFLQLLACSHSR